MSNPKNNQYELFLYRILGIKKIKKFVLAFERKIHKKRGKTLHNYHPDAMSLDGLERFKWYILYNCFLHVLSIFLIGIYFLISYCFGNSYLVFHIIAIFFLLFNLALILLQRTNWLKVDKFIQHKEAMLKKRYDRCCAKIDGLDSVNVSRSDYEDDRLLLKSISQYLSKEEDCCISTKEVACLKRYKMLFEKTGLKELEAAKASYDNPMHDSSMNVCQAFENVCIHRMEDAAVDFFRRILDRENYEKESCKHVLMTDSKEAEEAFSKVFGEGTAEVFRFKVQVLQYIYDTKMCMES